MAELGKKFETNNTIFKKYPSCGCTLASTDAILDLVREMNLNADDVTGIQVKVSPYAFKLSGHPFEIGDNPKVNAQFSIQYCVGNALLRRGPKLEDFDDGHIKDDKVLELVKRIEVLADPSLSDPKINERSAT